MEGRAGRGCCRLGKIDLLLVEKEKWGKDSGVSSASYTRRRGGHGSQEAGDQASGQAPQVEGVGEQDGCQAGELGWSVGVVSVGFSPDRQPEFARRGVVAFVVFETVAQRNAALVDEKVCYDVLCWTQSSSWQTD